MKQREYIKLVAEEIWRGEMPNLVDRSQASDMGRWDSSLVKKIFTAREKGRSEDRDNLLLLTSKRLYGKKIHYVLELIQNAEDEASSFIFDKHSATVINDGRPFDERGVWGICSVRPGRKKNKIGFFGRKTSSNIKRVQLPVTELYLSDTHSCSYFTGVLHSERPIFGGRLGSKKIRKGEDVW